ncbi:MAG: carboxypeptidase regulatory-like domain-containing protein [Dehalococcoidia bacterium]|nr:carboxypeptidase regulatory-like domain-containing protein [Dehalococcoidia bacterium]
MKVSIRKVIAFALVGLLIGGAVGVPLANQKICKGNSGDKLATAGFIQFGEAFPGSIDDVGEVDTDTFSAEANDTVISRLDTTSSGSNPQVSHVEVTPSLTNIRVGEPAQFTAQAYDNSGNEIVDLSFDWSTDVGFVDGSGYFRPAISSGTTGSSIAGYVRAFYGSVYGEARINIVSMQDARRIYEQPHLEDAISKTSVFASDVSGSISGHVYQDDGVTPIADILVGAESYCSNVNTYTHTAEDGSYSITVPGGWYYVEARSNPTYIGEYYTDAYSHSAATPILVTAPYDTSDIDFVLDVGGTISGHVYREDGFTPIPNMSIIIDGINSPFFWGYARTEADGSYSVALPIGNYNVWAFGNSEYAAEFYDNAYYEYEATPVAVTVPDDTPGIDFILERGGTISGFVYDEDGMPLPGGHVYTDYPISGHISNFRGFRTADNGSYTITGLQPGNYEVQAEATGHIDEYYDNVYESSEATPVQVTAHSNTPGINFHLDFGGSISGTVTDDGGSPIVGAMIYASDIDTYYDEYCCTGDDGSYIVSGLRPGSYLVSAEAPGYVLEYYSNVYESSEATPLLVTVPGNTPNINFSLEIGGSISGAVSDDSGNPIAGAWVNANGYDFGWGYTSTRNDGSYIVSGLPSGNYRVSAEATGFIEEYYDNVYDWSDATPVPVVKPNNTSNIDFSLELGGSISGVVKDDSGDPIAGAWVYASGYDSGWGYASTRNDGSYIVSGLPSGNYRVGAEATGFIEEYYDNVYDWSDASPVPVIKPNNTSNIDFSLGSLDSCADLGNPDDEVTHNLVGWGDAQVPPENPYVSPSGDRTKRCMLLRGDNSLDLGVSEIGVPYLLVAEIEDGYCTDNFEIYVDGHGPLYSYTGANGGAGNIAVVRHRVLVPQGYIIGASVTVTFRNTATDECGLAAVYNVRLQRAAQDDAKFVVDVTIPDGTEVEPNKQFIKTWRLRNAGATTWTTDYKLVFEGGDLMGAPQYVNLDTAVPPNATIDISVPMTAPLSGGAKKGYWRMENAAGLRFGDVVWVEVFVTYVPNPELQEAIDNLYDTTMERLEWLKRDMQTTAGHGDFFRGQIDVAKAGMALTLALGFLGTYSGVKDTMKDISIAEIKSGLYIARPSIDISSANKWTYLAYLRNRYDVAKFLFNLHWENFLETDPASLSREILTGGAKFYAAEFAKMAVEQVPSLEAEYLYKEMAKILGVFSGAMYPAFSSVIAMAELELTERRTELMESLPSLSAEEQLAYAADLNARARAARWLYLTSTHEVSNLGAIRGFYEQEWWEQVVLALLKITAKGLSNALDGPGKLFVEGFLTGFELYQHKFKLDESQRMVTLAESLMTGGVDTGIQLLLNAAGVINRVGDAIPPQPITGQIEGISQYSAGHTPWWNPWGWDETDSYSIIRVTNNSTEPADFRVVATYLADYEAIFGIGTLLADAAEEVVRDVAPGATVEVRLKYKDASSGDSPSKDLPMQIWVFGINPSGTFGIDAESTVWDPQLVAQAASQGLSALSIAQGGEEIQITDNPVYVFISALPEDLTYEVQTWVVNPVAANVTATIVQDLSEDWEVLSAPGASTNSSQLVWELELEAGGLAQVSFTFAYHGDLSLDIVVPSPIIALATPEGEPLGELIGNSPSLEPILPITGSVSMPVEVMPDDQATVSVDLRNLSLETAGGNVTIRVTDPSGRSAYNGTQAFSLAPSANETLEYLLPAFSEKGLYQVLTEMSHGGATRVMWRDVLRVGVIALDVSLNATPADRVYPGDTIIYTVSLNNTSNSTLRNVTAQATVPAGTVAHNISDNGQFEESMVKWQLPVPLPSGQTIELSFQATVMPDAIGPDEARPIISSATAVSDEAFSAGSNAARILLVGRPAPIMGTISGDVDLYGQMERSGVLVTVNATYITTTVSDGSFAIDVPGGTHNVTFAYPGFHTVAYDNVTVIAGEGISLPPVLLTPIETVEIQLSLKAGWNMVSVPLALADDSISEVFPGVAGIFTWNATSRSYYVPMVIEPEKGYWVAVTENTTITINGTPVDTWTTDIKAGWNMIGSVTTNSSIADPNDDPDGSVISTAYWWDPVSKSYILTTDIEPGKGYWVASQNDCTLIL